MTGSEQPYPPLEHIDVEDAKEILRKSIRSNRRKRSERRRSEAAAAIAQVLETFPPVAGASCVTAYASRPTEPGSGPFLERLAARGVRVLLPVLGDGLKRDWAPYAGPADLAERAPARPPEPGTEPVGPEAINEAQVLIVPALAVDTAGMRLGQGGGWYDRALKQIADDVPVIAVVFPEEVYDASTRPIPAAKHDRGVQAVATPEGWRWLGEAKTD